MKTTDWFTVSIRPRMCCRWKPSSWIPSRVKGCIAINQWIVEWHYSIPGIISLATNLDRETLSEHILTVMVRDAGTPAKKNLARVHVIVHDHNDHAPHFSDKILVSFPQNSSSRNSKSWTLAGGKGIWNCIDWKRGPQSPSSRSW